MIRSTTLAALALLAALPASAQYPERALNVIAGYPAGGMVDIVARAVSEGMKKRYPAGVIVVNDAARTAMEDPAFREAMASRGIDVDYRPGTQLRADLWREYKAHTEVLKRIGMIKN
jgi:tripartite-type tricarboxylate transporter receptor subunit TctC